MHRSIFGLVVFVAACSGRYEQLPDGAAGQPAQSSGSTSDTGSSAVAGSASSAANAGPAVIVGQPAAPDQPIPDPGTSPGTPAVMSSEDCGCNSVTAVAGGWACAPSSSAGPLPSMIGPAGGVITFDDYANVDGVPLTLTVPPGALSAPALITVSDALVPPAEFNPRTPGYVIDPPGLEFALPVAIRIPWGLLVGGSAPPNLGVFFAPDACSTAEELSDSYVNAGFLDGTLTSTGILFTGAPPIP